MTPFEAFHRLEDPRIDRRKRHLLEDIFVIAICAFICGADKWTEVEEFGLVKQSWFNLKKSVGLSHPTKFWQPMLERCSDTETVWRIELSPVKIFLQRFA